MLALAMRKGYIKMAPQTTRWGSHCQWPEIRMTMLDAAGDIEYREWSIKHQSPAKGDFVQNKKLGHENETERSSDS